MKFLRGLLFACSLLLASGLRAEEKIIWHEWSPEIFGQAKRENKFVLLDLEAVWCHWCHVMAEVTYREPEVVALINSRYLAVRVDQDSRPDLANRYEDYGWPATVIYGPDGGELVKRQGYITPRGMSSLLQAVIDDPTPGPSVVREKISVAASETVFGPRRAKVIKAWRDAYDTKAGGWGLSHKFLDWDNVEFALRLAARGDASAAAMARTTIRLQRKLVDPVWGGVYQYSAGGTWDEPHYEKIMQMQAENIRIDAQAYAQWGDPADLATARTIHAYLRKFLTSPDGVVYTSQDADLVPGEHSAEYFALDDTDRRARGIPRIDRHIYARENGWVISALCELSAATGDAGVRDEAVRAADWILEHRALPDGGFRHDERDAAGPYLGDTLAMGHAFLALHQLTADTRWLGHAMAAAEFIRNHFARSETEAGFASSDTTTNPFPAPRPQFDENVNVVRFATALSHVTGRAEFREISATALRWLLAAGIAEERGGYVGGLLLAEEEARTEPVHVMILGAKADPAARSLQAAALRFPDAHKLIEWWDRREGPPPRGEDIFPESSTATAFLCANGACSAPLRSVTVLEARLKKLTAPAE
jgi:uncharacterized protein YyaL (SSP411 family)